jgi:uncharacterized membrane protein YcaP (DUF421 family)
MDLQELGLTAGRAVVIYVFVLIVVRLLGKRTVGNFTAFDLIVAFIISELVVEPIYGDVPLVDAFVAIAAVAALHLANSFLGFRFPSFDALTGGKPRVLIENGKMIQDAMAAERVNKEELESMLRECEIDDIRDVARGTLETNGQLSVIKIEPAKELEKRDLDSREPKRASKK